MNKKLGFIGYGNMAKAMVTGILTKLEPENIMVSDIKIPTTTNIEVAEFADVLIIATKPNQYQDVVKEIKNDLKPETIVVSIAAGLTIKTLENLLGPSVKLVRAMPNTPAMVGLGMTGIIPNNLMTDADTKLVQELFSSFSKVEIVDESLIDAVIVTSGSSPAYLYMMMEAMIKGGIAEGMTREMATSFVTQAVMGAAQMAASSDESPNKLRDNVCSPNGTTIEAVKSLKHANFEEIVMTAMKACADRSREMAKE